MTPMPKPTHVMYFVPVDGPPVDLCDDDVPSEDTAATAATLRS